MAELLLESSLWGIGLTVAAFCVGMACQNRWKLAIANPILIGAIIMVLALFILDIPVAQYQKACEAMTALMTPATICLAISFYEHLQKLKKHLPAILTGVTSGTVSGLLSVRLLCFLFGFSEALTVSLLPKSITSAIGVELSEQFGEIRMLWFPILALMA